VGMLAMTLASGVALADPGSSKGFGQGQGGGDVTHGDNGKHNAIGGGTSNNPHNNDCSICGGSLLRGSSAEGRSLASSALIPLFTNVVEEEFSEVHIQDVEDFNLVSHANGPGVRCMVRTRRVTNAHIHDVAA
jgi:hypothetical protein